MRLAFSSFVTAAALLATSFAAQAQTAAGAHQTQVVRGVVRADNDEPLTDAVVSLNGRRLHASTNSQGEFQLTIKAGQSHNSLVITRPGYVPQKLSPATGDYLLVVLQPRVIRGKAWRETPETSVTAASSQYPPSSEASFVARSGQ